MRCHHGETYVSQLWFIDNWVITGFPWMVEWWELGCIIQITWLEVKQSSKLVNRSRCNLLRDFYSVCTARRCRFLFYGAEQNTGLTEQDHVNMNLWKEVSAREMKVIMPWYNKIQVPTSIFIWKLWQFQIEKSQASWNSALETFLPCEIPFLAKKIHSLKFPMCSLTCCQ